MIRGGPSFSFIPLLSPHCHSHRAWEWVLICYVWALSSHTFARTYKNTHGTNITSRNVWEMSHRDTIQASRNTLIVKWDEPCNINQSIIKHHLRLTLTSWGTALKCTHTDLLDEPEEGLWEVIEFNWKKIKEDCWYKFIGISSVREVWHHGYSLKCWRVMLC